MLASSIALVSPTDAAVILQGAADNYIAFEAEDNIAASGTDTISSSLHQWGEVANGGASGGAAMQAQGAGSPAPDDNTAFLTWDVEFVTAGDYNLYARVLATGTGSDSAHQGSTWNQTAGTNAFVYVGASSPSASYQWINGNGGADFEVLTADVGNTITFSVSIRENAFQFDRFVFSTDNSLTAAELDALSNSSVIPEPSAYGALTGGLALAIVLLRRRVSNR